MQRSTLGIRVHSGWGALVAVAGRAATLEVIERRCIEIIDPHVAGAFQPYHFAKTLEIGPAKQHVARSAAASERLALAAIRNVVDQLRDRGYKVIGASILLSSGRPLPAFEKILVSHPMIHTAEGEFFRQAFREACRSLKVPISGIRERELEEQARTVFGKTMPALKQKIAGLGRSLGPPWTTDQKNAALAAAITLAQ
jgi:hypothetical protein